MKNKSTETVNCSKYWTRIILQDSPNLQVLLQWTNQCLVKKQRQTHTIKPEQWPLQSQPAHSKCKGDKTGDTCVADMKQIRPLWRDHYGVETYAMTCKN